MFLNDRSIENVKRIKFFCQLNSLNPNRTNPALYCQNLSKGEMTDRDVKLLMGGPHSWESLWLEVTNVKYIMLHGKNG